ILTNNVRLHIPSTSDRLDPYFVAGGGVANLRNSADFVYSPFYTPVLPRGVRSNYSAGIADHSTDHDVIDSARPHTGRRHRRSGSVALGRRGSTPVQADGFGRQESGTLRSGSSLQVL